MTGVRCFVAVPLPQPVVAGLLLAGDALRTTDDAWRQEKWVTGDNLHLTLKFLGELDEGHLERLYELLGDSIGATSAFELPFTGITASGGLRRCRMLWATFSDPQHRCAELHDAVQHVADGLGVPADSKPFAPHVTLCRARRPRPISALALEAANAAAKSAPPSMSVVRASLFTSRLTPRGPIYREIGTWRLRGE